MPTFRSSVSIRFGTALALVGGGISFACLAFSDGASNTGSASTAATAAASAPLVQAPRAAVTPSAKVSADTILSAAAPQPDPSTAAAVTGLFIADAEQIYNGNHALTGAQIAFYTINLGATDTFAAYSPATLSKQGNDVDFPNDLLFDGVGDLLIANGGAGSPDFGNFSCVPASAIATGANAATVLTNNMNNPRFIAFLTDSSVALANATAAAPKTSDFTLAGTYVFSPTRSVANTGAYTNIGANQVIALPTTAANPAGTYAVAISDGTTQAGNHVVIKRPDGTSVELPSDPSDVDSNIGYDAQNNQLVVVNSNSTSSKITFWDVATLTKQKTIVIDPDSGNNAQAVPSQAGSVVAVSPTGYVAVSTLLVGNEINIYNNNPASRALVSAPIPFDSTQSNAGGGFGNDYCYGGNDPTVGSRVLSTRWLPTGGGTFNKLLVGLESNKGSSPNVTPTAANGLYIFDITQSSNTPVAPSVCSGTTYTYPWLASNPSGAVQPFAKQTGFIHLTTAPLATGVRAAVITSAAGVGVSCNGDPQCYTSINAAISNTAAGGTINVLGGTFSEDVVLNSNVFINLDANTTVNSLSISAGTFNLGGGFCGQPGAFNLTLATGNLTTSGSGTFNAGSATLTLNAGNWVNNGGTFNQGTGTVVFTGSGARTIGGSAQTTFSNLTINEASGVTLSLSTTVGGTLSLTSGALSVGTNTLTLNGPATSTSGSITSSATGTVNYNQGTNGQTVAPGSYGNLTFSNFTKTLPSSGTVSIAGTFTTGATGGHTVTGSTVAFNGASAQTVSANFTTYNNLTISNATGVTLGGNIAVNGALNLTSGNITTNANILSIGSAGTRSRTSGYILGNEKKTYSAVGSFTYDVGTANGYSPVDVTTTAGTGDLTVVAVQGAEPSVVSARSLQRYWTLTKGGAGVTANLVFHYIDPTDIMGTESNYQSLQVTGGARTYYTNNCPNTCENAAVNTFSIAGVTSFSDFTAGEARADVQITSLTDSPDPVVAGNNITYTINLINNGPDDSSSVTVSDSLPPNTTFVSTSMPVGWSRTDGVTVGGTGAIGFAKGTVANAETAALQVVVKVNANAVGGSTISDNAVTTSNVTMDPNLGNNSGFATTLVYTLPAITSGNNTTVVVGTAGTFTVATTGFPTPTVAESGTLPNGVTFDISTNKLSGTPAAGTGGTYSIIFTASNAAGSTPAQSFTLTVNQAPAITSANTTTFTAGTAGNFNVIATGYPSPTVSLTNGSLPSGVNYGNATLAGTPAAIAFGTYPLTFTASNGVGSDAVQSFSLVVNPSAQDVKSKPSITANVGGGFHVAFIGNPGKQYTIQFAPTLPVLPAVPNWQTLSLQTANASGIFSVDDTPGTTVRFYRAIIP